MTPVRFTASHIRDTPCDPAGYQFSCKVFKSMKIMNLRNIDSTHITIGTLRAVSLSFVRVKQMTQTITTKKRAISRDANSQARARRMTIMKKLMMIAVVAGALLVVGSASNAQAGGWYGGYYGGNNGISVGFGNGYGNYYRGGYGGGYGGYGGGYGYGNRGWYGHNHGYGNGYGYGGYGCRPGFGGYGGGYRW